MKNVPERNNPWILCGIFLFRLNGPRKVRDRKRLFQRRQNACRLIPPETKEHLQWRVWNYELLRNLWQHDQLIDFCFQQCIYLDLMFIVERLKFWSNEFQQHAPFLDKICNNEATQHSGFAHSKASKIN